MYLKGVQDKVKVIVVRTLTDPIILISTDLTLTAKEIIEIYSARFQIELTIRDLKQYFGFGDYQCRSSLSINRFSFLSCLSHCIGRLMLIKDQVIDCDTEMKRKESQFSFSRLRKGLRCQMIKKIIFNHSAVTAEDEKINNEYETLAKLLA